ncbi:MAG: LysR family transcriptional regulator [Candidatus Eisenbacteria bacterium]|nr:LysR family transcriptional regulator [Candidatus Eisenbacteria bacterium]
MDLDVLQTFVLAVQLGSLTAAGKARFRTQPAISAQIRNLEREAGDPLLVREARGVRPTPAGEILYARAQEILRQTHELVGELRAGGSLQTGRLRIGATDVMAIHFLPPVVAKFRRLHPGVRLTVEVQGSRALARRVRNGELDLALVTLPAEEADLSVLEIHHEPVFFVASPEHPWAGRRVTLADVAREGMIHHHGDSITREEIAAVFRTQGLEPRVTMEVSSPEAIKALVALGLGIAPLSRAQVTSEIRDGRLVRLRVAGFRSARRSGVIRRRAAPPLRVVSAFLRTLPGRAGRRAGPPQ